MNVKQPLHPETGQEQTRRNGPIVTSVSSFPAGRIQRVKGWRLKVNNHVYLYLFHRGLSHDGLCHCLHCLYCTISYYITTATQSGKSFRPQFFDLMAETVRYENQLTYHPLLVSCVYNHVTCDLICIVQYTLIYYLSLDQPFPYKLDSLAQQLSVSSALWCRVDWLSLWFDLGTSFDGFSSKKLTGLSTMLIFSLGMTGKSIIPVSPNPQKPSQVN